MPWNRAVVSGGCFDCSKLVLHCRKTHGLAVRRASYYLGRRDAGFSDHNNGSAFGDPELRLADLGFRQTSLICSMVASIPQAVNGHTITRF